MKPLHIAVLGITVVAILAAVFLANLREQTRRDDVFRSRCMELKRVYEAPEGSCLGYAQNDVVKPVAKKAPGERTWNDLAASCKEAGGWINSSAGSNTPKCSIPGEDSKEMAPP